MFSTAASTLTAVTVTGCFFLSKTIKDSKENQPQLWDGFVLNPAVAQLKENHHQLKDDHQQVLFDPPAFSSIFVELSL